MTSLKQMTEQRIAELEAGVKYATDMIELAKKRGNKDMLAEYTQEQIDLAAELYRVKYLLS